MPRRKLDLHNLAKQFSGQTLLGYESPNRVLSTVRSVAEIQPDRVVHVVRELTKIYEEVITGTLSELAESDRLDQVRGEIVLIFEGESQIPGIDNGPEFGRAVQLAGQLQSAGLSLSVAAATAAKHEGVRRSSVYDAVVSGLPQAD
jgi:16S rRNA (cytidine1402-2'-O)-methyltransferase